MDQGPVLIITFQAQVVMVIRSPKGDVVEGDPVSQLLVNCTWALKLIDEAARKFELEVNNKSLKQCWCYGIGLTFSTPPPLTGESDEDDARLGFVPRPGGAEPQRSVEAAGHLRLQHWAGPLNEEGCMGEEAHQELNVTEDKRCSCSSCMHWTNLRGQSKKNLLLCDWTHSHQQRIYVLMYIIAPWNT